jgi:site-specific DNA-methyltransferase (adenine-specific)
MKVKAEVINGDSLIEVPKLGLERRRVAIITDNPYGMDNDADYSRLTGGKGYDHLRISHPQIQGDNRPFDPTPWLDYQFVTLWGYQFLAPRLPLGSILAWQKKSDEKLGKVLSDGELGWQKGGYGVYFFRHVWDGFCRESEGHEHYHSNQKPVALMRWCIERQNIPRDFTILDPYCGSGTTLIAALQLGYDCIGIDVDAHNCAVSEARAKRASGIGCDVPRRQTRQIETPLFG